MTEKPFNPLLAFVIVIVAGIVPLAIVALVMFEPNISSDNKTDADLRRAALTARAEQIKQQTDGVITIMPENVSFPYGLTPGGRYNVQVVVGTCREVLGYFTMSPAPKDVSAVGELTLVIPGVNPDTAPAQVPLSDPNLPQTLAASGLSHCVAKKN